MRKRLSVVDQRIYELKRHYLYKVWFSFLVPFFILMIICVIYVLPTCCDVFYHDFFFNHFGLIYAEGVSQILIDVIVFALAVLISTIIMLGVSFVCNKKFQKIYQTVLYDELTLYEFYQSSSNFVDEIELSELLVHLPFNRVVKEDVMILKKDYDFALYQLHLKGSTYKHAGLFVLKNERKKNEFIQISSSLQCPQKNYQGKDTISFHYDSNKFASKIDVFSTYGKKTNQICNYDFLSLFDQLQRFCKCKIVIISYLNYLFLIIPGWEFRLSVNVLSFFKQNSMDKKVSSIERIYQYMNQIEKKIYEVK